MEITDIEISKIKVIENIRSKINDSQIAELMQSIKQHGLEQAIGVSGPTKSKEYILIFGYRRLVACTKLGWKTIPAVVKKDIPLKQHLILNMIENVQRKDVTVYELGRMCSRFKREFNMTNEEVAVNLNISHRRVRLAIEAFDILPIEMKDKVKFFHTKESRNGYIPVSVISYLMTARRKFNLTHSVYKKLLNNIHLEGLTTTDISIIGKMLESGEIADNAIKKARNFTSQGIDCILSWEEIKEKKEKYGLTPTKILEAIIYGEIPPFKRPDFLIKKVVR